MANADNIRIALHRAGSTDPDQLDGLIDKAWSDAIDNPAEQARIGAILGLTERELKSLPPPFRVRVEKAGLTGAEVLIILATAFATAYAKEIGTATAKATVRKTQELWRLVKDKILDSEPEALGSEVDESDK